MITREKAEWNILSVSDRLDTLYHPEDLFDNKHPDLIRCSNGDVRVVWTAINKRQGAPAPLKMWHTYHRCLTAGTGWQEPYRVSLEGDGRSNITSAKETNPRIALLRRQRGHEGVVDTAVVSFVAYSNFGEGIFTGEIIVADDLRQTEVPAAFSRDDSAALSGHSVDPGFWHPITHISGMRLEIGEPFIVAGAIQQPPSDPSLSVYFSKYQLGGLPGQRSTPIFRAWRSPAGRRPWTDNVSIATGPPLPPIPYQFARPVASGIYSTNPRSDLVLVVFENSADFGNGLFYQLVTDNEKGSSIFGSGQPVPGADLAGQAKYPSIAWRPPPFGQGKGRCFIAYYSSVRQTTMLHCFDCNTGAWLRDYPVSVASGPAGYQPAPAIAVDSQGIIWVAYVKEDNNIYVNSMHYHDPPVWRGEEQIIENGLRHERISIAFNWQEATNIPVIAYMERDEINRRSNIFLAARGSESLGFRRG